MEEKTKEILRKQLELLSENIKDSVVIIATTEPNNSGSTRLCNMEQAVVLIMELFIKSPRRVEFDFTGSTTEFLSNV